MEIIEVIRQRRSVRAFKPDPVPRDVLTELMELALRAPSSANTQPWEFAIVAGDELEAIRAAYVERGRAREQWKPELASPVEVPEPYNARRHKVGKQLFEIMGIARDDTERRAAWYLQGLALFGAPCAVYILTDRSFCFQKDGLNLWPIFDCGLIAENIVLLAASYGLGTIPESQAVVYPDILRNVLGIPDSKLIVVGIAVGYPDWSNPLNTLRSERESLDKVANWYGFH